MQAAPALGPQSVPDLSLSVPRLGPGGPSSSHLTSTAAMSPALGSGPSMSPPTKQATSSTRTMPPQLPRTMTMAKPGDGGNRLPPSSSHLSSAPTMPSPLKNQGPNASSQSYVGLGSPLFTDLYQNTGDPILAPTTASARRAMMAQDKEQQVAQSVQDFPSMLRGGRSSSSSRSRLRRRPSSHSERLLPRDSTNHRASSAHGPYGRSMSVRRSSSLGLSGSPPGAVQQSNFSGDLGVISGSSPTQMRSRRPSSQAALDITRNTSRGSSAERRSHSTESLSWQMRNRSPRMLRNPSGSMLANGFDHGIIRRDTSGNIPTTYAPSPHVNNEWRTASADWSSTPSILRADRNSWHRAGYEPLGPMLRSLEFQVGALFELMDAHTFRDVADHSIADVIDRKRESLAETFDAIKDVLLREQGHLRQEKRRQRESEVWSPSRPSSLGIASASTAQNGLQFAPSVGSTSRPGGLQELDALRSQLSQRVAAVVDDGVFSECSGYSSNTGRVSIPPHLSSEGSLQAHSSHVFTPNPVISLASFGQASRIDQTKQLHAPPQTNAPMMQIGENYASAHHSMWNASTHHGMWNAPSVANSEGILGSQMIPPGSSELLNSLAQSGVYATMPSDVPPHLGQERPISSTYGNSITASGTAARYDQNYRTPEGSMNSVLQGSVLLPQHVANPQLNESLESTHAFRAQAQIPQSMVPQPAQQIQSSQLESLTALALATASGTVAGMQTAALSASPDSANNASPFAVPNPMESVMRQAEAIQSGPFSRPVASTPSSVPVGPAPSTTGELIQGTALQPLMLTPTQFHYRSSG